MKIRDNEIDSVLQTKSFKNRSDRENYKMCLTAGGDGRGWAIEGSPGYKLADAKFKAFEKFTAEMQVFVKNNQEETLRSAPTPKPATPVSGEKPVSSYRYGTGPKGSLEYKTVFFQDSEIAYRPLDDRLNEFSGEGWEVMSTRRANDGYFWGVEIMLKRIVK